MLRMRPSKASKIGLSKIVPKPAITTRSTSWASSTSITWSVYASAVEVLAEARPLDQHRLARRARSATSVAAARPVDDDDGDRDASVEDGFEDRPAPRRQHPDPHDRQRYPALVHGPRALRYADVLGRTPLHEEAERLAEFDLKKVTTNDWILAGGASLCSSASSSRGSSGIDVSRLRPVLRRTASTASTTSSRARSRGSSRSRFVVLLDLRKFFAEDVKMPDQAGSLTWSQVYLIASAVAAVLVLSRLLMGDGR